MHNLLIIGTIVFFGRVVQDIFFLGKIDAFQKSKKPYMMAMNFLDAVYGILMLRYVIHYIDISVLFAVVFGLGSAIGGLLIIKLRDRLNKRLKGQRRFFIRISSPKKMLDLISLLKKEKYQFSIDRKKYTDGKVMTVLEGGVDTVVRKDRIKELLRGRMDKHVVIVRAEEVYYLRRRV